MPKRIAVLGATGSQGSSIVRTLLSSSDSSSWTVRAITRNSSSKAAQELESLGAETFEADLNDAEATKAAFADCYAVFAMTDYFVPFFKSGANVEDAVAKEEKQVSNIFDAVKATPALEHFIWSTLPNAGKISGGKYSPGHFTSKNRMEERIKADPEVLAKTTFLWVGWYGNNFLYPIFQPTKFATAGESYIQLGPVGADVPITAIGDPKKNVGPFVLSILQQPERTMQGTYVAAVTEVTSMRLLVDAWSKATGKEALFVKCGVEEYRQLFPGWGVVEGDMLAFFDEFGAQIPASEEKILGAAELGVPIEGMVSVLDTVRLAIESQA